MPPETHGLLGTRTRGDFIFTRNEQATLDMVSDVERSIVASNLDSQGQFIALTNAIEMQLESRAPVPHVVRLLADAILALGLARGLPHPTRTDLAQRLDAICSSLTRASDAQPGR